MQLGSYGGEWLSKLLYRTPAWALHVAVGVATFLGAVFEFLRAGKHGCYAERATSDCQVSALCCSMICPTCCVYCAFQSLLLCLPLLFSAVFLEFVAVILVFCYDLVIARKPHIWLSLRTVPISWPVPYPDMAWLTVPYAKYWHTRCLSSAHAPCNNIYCLHFSYHMSLSTELLIHA